MLFDTHCHLNFNAYKDDALEIAKSSLDRDVWVINVGSQATTSERAVEMANKFEKGIYAAVGLHPSHLFTMEVEEEEAQFETRGEEFDYDFYKTLAGNEKTVAIGETGLDYNYIPQGVTLEEVRIKQQAIFKSHLDLAGEMNLPVIVHSRDTYDELYKILKDYIDAGRLERRAVIHCYLGDWKNAQKFLGIGCMISFTGIITFPPKKSQADQSRAIFEAIEKIPMESIMVETDAPFLSPAPYRGERNLPWRVEEVAKKIADIKGVSFSEVAEITTENARYFFGV